MATTFQSRTIVDIKLSDDLSLLRTEAKLVANYSVDIELDLNAAFASVVLDGVPISNVDEAVPSNLTHTINTSYDGDLFDAMNGIKAGTWAQLKADSEEVSLEAQMLTVVRRCLYENGYPEPELGANSEGTGSDAPAGKGNVIDTGLLRTWINSGFASHSDEVAGTDSNNSDYSTTHDFGKMVFQAVHLNEIFTRAINANRYREVNGFVPSTPEYQIDFEDEDICTVKCILYNQDETSETSFLFNMHHKGVVSNAPVFSITQYTVDQDVASTLFVLSASGGDDITFAISSDPGNNFKSLSGTNNEELQLDNANNKSLGDYTLEVTATNSQGFETTDTITVTLVDL